MSKIEASISDSSWKCFKCHAILVLRVSLESNFVVLTLLFFGENHCILDNYCFEVMFRWGVWGCSRVANHLVAIIVLGLSGL